MNISTIHTDSPVWGSNLRYVEEVTRTRELAWRLTDDGSWSADQENGGPQTLTLQPDGLRCVRADITIFMPQSPDLNRIYEAIIEQQIS
jgi:hypothetical protein